MCAHTRPVGMETPCHYSSLARARVPLVKDGPLMNYRSEPASQLQAGLCFSGWEPPNQALGHFLVRAHFCVFLRYINEATLPVFRSVIFTAFRPTVTLWRLVV